MVDIKGTFQEGSNLRSLRLRIRCAILSILAAPACLVGAPAIAQQYPSKPIRIVTAAAGGGIDLAARVIAHGYTSALGQQAIVDNRGGSALIAADVVANAPPDGHTLLYYGSAVWLAPFMGGKVPYDPVKSFAPITLAVSAPNVLVVTPSIHVGSVGDLIAFARAKPDRKSTRLNSSHLSVSRMPSSA